MTRNAMTVSNESVSVVKRNDIKLAITHNEPIDSVLHCVTMISNPCQYTTRYTLSRRFINRMQFERNVILYVVEIAYGDQEFHVTEANNPRHLQLRLSKTQILWSKENAINVGVSKLLPNDWKAMAWIDSDVIFENATWALDTLKVLNGCRDVVQNFSHALDLSKDGDCSKIFTGLGFQYCNTRPVACDAYVTPITLFHTGYSWSITRSSFDRMGGLYELSILGSADYQMGLCFIGEGVNSVNVGMSSDYRQSILDFQQRVSLLRLGYVPGVILHEFHGKKKYRRYSTRWKILVKHQYRPSVHIVKNDDGLIIPSKDCPKELLKDIVEYFKSRNEDR
jgi:hypothetical protein